MVEVDVPPFQFLMVEGRGAPEGQEYPDAIATLYPVVYTLKFALKPERDFAIGPLESLWWDDTPGGFNVARREGWKWIAMIVVPDFVTQDDLAAAVDKVRGKGKPAALLDRIRLETLDEGRCVQIMHIGPYDAETPTIRQLHDYMTDNGLSFRGKHHEIYLSDPRTTAPERMKTVIRQPVH
ncbi:MAG: GyrI-like domain-containing protein [Acidimicrobiia bacterium]|nr:GyrI-like domain-containing protein [Acidimicrobiia bacterium]